MFFSFILLVVSLLFPAIAIEKGNNCTTAISTVEVNACAREALRTSEQKLDRYLKASENILATNPDTLKLLTNSHLIWQRYKVSHCDTIYQYWIGGTIRTANKLQCQINLNNQRTKELWRSFLTFVDSTPPRLPDPESS